MLRDIRYTLRLLLRNPGFAVTAIVSMACGIAACTAVFSLVYTLLMRPLAVPRAEDVVSIYGVSKEKGTFTSAGTSLPNFRDLAARTDLFESVGAYFRYPILVDSGDETERLRAELATGNYHAMLGVRPVLGRMVMPDDDRPGAPTIVVLSERFWRQRYNASPDVIGRQLRINGRPFEIVGVAPASFTGVLLDWYGSPEVWMPLSQLAVSNKAFAELEMYTKRELGFLQVTARLRPGMTAEAATAALQTQAEQLARAYPASNKDLSFTALPTSRARFWPGRRGVVVDFAAMVLSTTGVLLLIAVLNVANLLLARLSTRQREISIRLSIGADRLVLGRQLLIEGVVLAGAATLASVPLSLLLTRLIVRMDLPFYVSNRAVDLTPDWRVFSIVAGLCGACGLLLGLIPAARAWRTDVRAGLSDVASTARRTMFGAWDLRHTLAALQIAICLTLTLGAGLLAKSLVGLSRVDLGLNPDRVTLFELETYILNYSKEQDAAFRQNLLTRVRRLSGVEAASIAFHPLPGSYNATKILTVPDSLEPKAREGLSARFNVVTGGYFETVRLPLIAGRAFADRDTDIDESRVAIINETAARRLWKDPTRAIGQRLHVKNEPGLRVGQEMDRDVIGVVRDFIMDRPDEPATPYLFEPLDRSWTGSMSMHVLGPREPGQLIAQVKRELRAIDRSLAFSDVATLDQAAAARIAEPRLAARLSITASLVGAALAILGLYAVLAYLVAQRRTELAIRMSLGAGPSQIMRFVTGFGLKITLAGAVLGLAGSFFTMHLIATQLRGVDISDPLVYALVITLVLLASFAACLLPARRAARLEPWVILRR